MKILPIVSLVALLAPGALAQGVPAESMDRIPSRDGSAWMLGGAVMVREGIYAGEDANIIPIPFIGYEGKDFYVRGLTGGYHLLNGETLSVDAEIGLRPGFERDDLGVAELAANGVNRAYLEDRDWAADLGLAATWQAPVGEVKIEARTDIVDASGGQEYGLSYQYPIRMGATMITPSIGAKYLSDDMANYYYGTLDAEVARGAPDYKPGGATIPEVGISVFHQMGDGWNAIGMARYEFLPDEITDSPLMRQNKDGYASVMLGVARSF